MRPLLVALLSTLALASAGCAKKTSEVSATYVSPDRYEGYLCSQLRDEATKVSQRSGAVYSEQNQKASVGAVAYWPKALVFGSAGGSDDEVARLKGEMAAIEQASNRKNCPIQFQQPGGDAGAAAPHYDGGRLTPTMSAGAGGSIYNAPPKVAPH